ncbi:MAG TPA: VCBS repeat-containing protein [Pyrinomonadaceae bacterium]|nr:VCBS repeat-containing protein [Pyrinomonadaceae bacterium]
MRSFSRIFQSAATSFAIAALFIIQAAIVPQAISAQNLAESGNLLAPFTPGNIVVYRVGDGSTALVNTGSAVFLDEFTPTGTLVQSIALPTTASGSNRQLIANGTSSAEGFITRSSDGRYLIVTGYARNLGGTGAVSAATSADVPRVIGRIDANGVIDTSTAITDTFSGANIRSATSTNGTDFWAVGSSNGVRYLTLGSSTTTQINTGGTPPTNLRQVNIFDNQLYVSHDTTVGATTIVSAVGTGVPTTTGQTVNSLPGVPIAADTGANAYAFFFADLSAAVPGVDTLYIADEETGLRKFSLVSGTWTSNGAIGVNADDYRGVTGVVSGTSVTLYATRKGGSGATGGGELVSLVDASGYNGTITGEPTLLATAALNTAFRGVALAPTGGTVVVNRKRFDFDGDGRADISVFRPSASTWYILGSTSGFFATQFGISTDRIVPADYDGDGKTDVAVFRDGNWFVQQSSNNAFRAFQFGSAGDIPLPFDYDGDNKADFAVFRSGAWYISQSSNNAFRAVNFGISTDKPVPADYDGDGKTDIAVFRDGFWYYTQSSDNGFRAVQFGSTGDRPIPADYDGDSKADLAVFRGGNWYIQQSSNNAFRAVQFGIASDIPVPADYDGDNRADIAVFRDGFWYYTQSSNNQFVAVQFGSAGDRPIPAAYLP